ncbi:MAG TPA: HAMP domain-containing sensor histidine kinase [Anaeromyxobacteraceae bacterium]|nr:HAMP domain-containing sensor histidine kinase [Anaeromyxobacteraceae bacterium]
MAALLALAGLAVTVLSARPLQAPFFMFQFAAVVGAALHGGLGPGLLTMVLSGIGFYAFFFAPTLQPHEAYRLAAFVVVSVFFAWLASKMREAKRRAEAAEAEARTMAARQERLVAIVSHDFKNPLHAIAFTLEHLRRRGAVEPVHANGLDRIESSTRRMQAMVRDLLDYARAQHGPGLRVERAPARLGEVCRAALEEVRAAEPGRTVALEVHGDDAALIDAARVEQLVCNLAVNALHHGAAGAPVDVRVSGQDEAVCLEVANAGALSPDLLPTLFDPFRPGDRSGSVGLGLFIVREIARAHGGHVAVRSEQGRTAFTVTFPRPAPPPGAAALSVTACSEPDGASAR